MYCTNEMKIRAGLEDKEHKNKTVNNEDVNLGINEYSAGKTSVFKDSRIFCILFLVFLCHVYSSTTTFFAPILALDHFHLEVIHSKLLFVNGAMFILLASIGFYFASEYLEERKLYIFALLMQIIAITCLSCLAFSWDDMTDGHYYILLINVCLEMQNFGYPFGNSIISKIIDPKNAAFFQGLSYASSHEAKLASRIAVSFVFTKLSLIWYCFVMVLLWFIGGTWHAVLYEGLVPNLSMNS